MFSVKRNKMDKKNWKISKNPFNWSRPRQDDTKTNQRTLLCLTFFFFQNHRANIQEFSSYRVTNTPPNFLQKSHKTWTFLGQ